MHSVDVPDALVSIWHIYWGAALVRVVREGFSKEVMSE